MSFWICESGNLLPLQELTIATVSAEITERLRPFATERDLLDTIPGVAVRTAEVLLAELGVDMCWFRTDRHLAS